MAEESGNWLLVVQKHLQRSHMASEWPRQDAKPGPSDSEAWAVQSLKGRDGGHSRLVLYHHLSLQDPHCLVLCYIIPPLYPSRPLSSPAATPNLRTHLFIMLFQSI